MRSEKIWKMSENYIGATEDYDEIQASIEDRAPRRDDENCEFSAVNLDEVRVIHVRTSKVGGDLDMLLFWTKGGTEHVVIGFKTAPDIREKASRSFVMDMLPKLEKMEKSPALVIDNLQFSLHLYSVNPFKSIIDKAKLSETVAN